MGNLKIIEKSPNVIQYIELRAAVGWDTVDIETATRGINNSTYCVCVECEDNLVGFGRVVGDGATVFYIHDIIVSPKYQKQKIGMKIMEKIMEYIHMNYSDKAFIGLVAREDLDSFYSKFGFSYNASNRFYRFKV